MGKVFKKESKIRFKHCDNAGIVFYPRYFEMPNDLVEDFFEEVLHRPFAELHKTHGIPTVNLTVNFQQPGKLGDVITKELWVKKTGKSSIICGFRFRTGQEVLNLEGEVVLVHVALGKGGTGIEAESLPEDMNKNLEQYIH